MWQHCASLSFRNPFTWQQLTTLLSDSHLHDKNWQHCCAPLSLRHPLNSNRLYCIVLQTSAYHATDDNIVALCCLSGIRLPCNRWQHCWTVLSFRHPFTGKQVTTSNGSGFIVRSDGVILTNAHVVANKSSVAVRLHDGRVLTGTVQAIDPISDLATVKVTAVRLNAANLDL